MSSHLRTTSIINGESGMVHGNLDSIFFLLGERDLDPFDEMIMSVMLTITVSTGSTMVSEMIPTVNVWNCTPSEKVSSVPNIK